MKFIVLYIIYVLGAYVGVFEQKSLPTSASFSCKQLYGMKFIVLYIIYVLGAYVGVFEQKSLPTSASFSCKQLYGMVLH